ncbi:MAG: DUF3141 domain-containing protein [Proteobacteria bacterium]|nr:DUF3141 domain-containing protein [Pseudomonadota bacterium]
MLQRTIDQSTRVARFWSELIPGPQHTPTWTTDHAVILETPSFALRDFGGGAPGSEHPLLIVAPEVNGSTLADYGPGQSLVQVGKAAGFGRVCVLHWKQVTTATCDRDVDDSIADIVTCIDALGGRAHLLGICQGGWEAAVVAAIEPDKAASLTLAGAAIDFRAGDGAITRLVDSVPPAAYRAFVAAGGGVMRGELLRAGFDNLQWIKRKLVDPIRLWDDLDDEVFLERRATMDRWYRVTKDLPGPQYLRVVEELFRHNRLIDGSFEVFGEPVDLGAVRCPTAMVAGSADHITLPEQVFAMEEHGGASVTRQFLIPGGHIGLVVGGRAQRDHWPEIFAWVLAQGEPAAAA